MDPIADMFSQLRNAQMVSKLNLTLPFSNLKLAILQVLKEKGFILDFKESEFKKPLSTVEKENSKNSKTYKANKTHKAIEITLKKNDTIKIDRISRPGRRVYVSASRIPRAKSPQGMLIVSTSEGLMAGEDARKKSVGGELIAEVLK